MIADGSLPRMAALWDLYLTADRRKYTPWRASTSFLRRRWEMSTRQVRELLEDLDGAGLIGWDRGGPSESQRITVKRPVFYKKAEQLREHLPEHLREQQNADEQPIVENHGTPAGTPAGTVGGNNIPRIHLPTDPPLPSFPLPPTPPGTGSASADAAAGKVKAAESAKATAAATTGCQHELLRVLKRWDTAEAPRRWVVKYADALSWYTKTFIGSDQFSEIDLRDQLVRWDLWLEAAADRYGKKGSKKGGVFPKNWKTALLNWMKNAKGYQDEKPKRKGPTRRRVAAGGRRRGQREGYAPQIFNIRTDDGLG